MKQSTLFTLIIASLILSGCLSNYPVVATSISPTSTLTKASPTLALTATFVSISTATEIYNMPNYPTANPTQASFLINQLLLQNDYCFSPCIWGIVPDKTTLEESRSIFAHLGHPLKKTSGEGGIDSYNSSFGSADGLGMGLFYSIIITVQDGVVNGLRVNITTTNNVDGTPVPHKLWAAYSPENALKRYGVPSSVEFIASQGPTTNGHAYLHWYMYLYYEPFDLILEYALGTKDEVGSERPVHICPQTIPTDSVKIWLGKKAANPPDKNGHKALEEVTTLSLNDFYELVATNNGCFDLEKNK